MRPVYLFIAFIVISSGCSFMAPKPVQNVLFTPTTEPSTQPSGPEIKQVTGGIVMDVDRPTGVNASGAKVLGEAIGIKSVNGNSTVLNFNFNSGWVSNLTIGAISLISIIMIIHAYHTKRRSS
jgi:hypothetical protein